MAFIWKRLAQLVVVLFFVSFLSFASLAVLPGNVVDAVCGISCTEEQRTEMATEMGLDRPLLVRYADWLGGAVQGDFGRSLTNEEEISEQIKDRFPVTLELVIYSQVLALAIAIPVAVAAARRAGGLFDRASTTIAFGGLSAPPYVVAPILVLLFAVKINIFPASGYTSFITNPFQNLRDLFLPALTIAIAEMAVYLRLLRTDLIATLQEDYITMAKAKGLSPKRILWKHAFRPSTFSLITVAGLNMGRLIGGAFIVEVIFALGGIGEYIVEAVIDRNAPAVQAGVVVVATAYVLINFGVDLLYAAIDPRIRHERATT